MNVCEDCPVRLFNTKNYNLQGIGNPYFGRCIVIPNVDYNSYKKGSIEFSHQVEIIKSLIPSTGELDNLYIIPLIRCNETISCEFNDDIYYRCITHFAYDLRKYDFKDILLLGDAGRHFLNCDISEHLEHMFITQNNRRYVLNYSPLVKYKDDNKFEVFKNHLIKWYNATTYKYYDYDIFKI